MQSERRSSFEKQQAAEDLRLAEMQSVKDMVLKLVTQIEIKQAARKRELLQSIVTLEAELLELRADALNNDVWSRGAPAGIAPALCQHVLDEWKEAKRLHQNTVDELVESKQDVGNLQEKVFEWKEKSKTLTCTRSVAR